MENFFGKFGAWEPFILGAKMRGESMQKEFLPNRRHFWCHKKGDSLKEKTFLFRGGKTFSPIGSSSYEDSCRPTPNRCRWLLLLGIISSPLQDLFLLAIPKVQNNEGINMTTFILEGLQPSTEKRVVELMVPE